MGDDAVIFRQNPCYCVGRKDDDDDDDDEDGDDGDDVWTDGWMDNGAMICK